MWIYVGFSKQKLVTCVVRCVVTCVNMLKYDADHFRMVKALETCRNVFLIFVRYLVGKFVNIPVCCHHFVLHRVLCIVCSFMCYDRFSSCKNWCVLYDNCISFEMILQSWYVERFSLQ